MRQQYERIRADHGFRLLDYTVDADAASPRVCFQFSEDLPGKRTDFSPFVAVAGQDKPALSVQDRQLCVEGLKHGERYAVTLRAGIPSIVKETLSKSADFNIYVRDRKPLVRFTGKSYVLPRTGQRGIPVVSVNTAAVALEIYRIGDRNLLETVVGRDFQRNLDRYDLDRLTEERGFQVWKGEMTVEQTLNTDVTTAFPVDQAIGTLAPGVYVMVAEVRRRDQRRIRCARDPMVHRLRSRADRALRQRRHPRLRAFARYHPTQGHGRNPAAVARQRDSLAQADQRYRPRSLRGQSDARRRLAGAGHADRERQQGRLRLLEPQGAGLRSERSRRLRAGGAGRPRCLRLYRARRLPLGRDRAGHGAAARQQGHGRAQHAGHARGRAAGRRRIPPQRRSRSGRGRARAAGAAGVVGSDRYLARARIHRSEASAGRRGDLHGRGLRARPARIRARLQRQGHLQDEPRGGHRRRPLSLWRAGGQARARRRGDREAGERAAGLCPLSVRAHRRGRRDRPGAVGEPAGNRCQRQSPFPRDAREAAGHDPSRSKLKSPSAWPSRAGARSSASSPCRSFPAGR